MLGSQHSNFASKDERDRIVGQLLALAMILSRPVGRTQEAMSGLGVGRRQSAPEKGAYDILRAVLFDLTSAEHALTIVQEAVPDDERARHLTAIRRALEQLRTFL